MMSNEAREYIRWLPNRLCVHVTYPERYLTEVDGPTKPDVVALLRKRCAHHVAEKILDKLSWVAEWLGQDPALYSYNRTKTFRGECYCFSDDEFVAFARKMYELGKADVTKPVNGA